MQKSTFCFFFCSFFMLLATTNLYAENFNLATDGVVGVKPVYTAKKTTKKYSYTLWGKKYTTLTTAEAKNFDKVGIASYYGGKFNGRKTANGEIFNENLFTAAHKTLPLNSYLLVTNLANGRRAVVKVNDRGPAYAKWEIDLSKRTAKELGMLKSGITKVRLQMIGVDKNGNFTDTGGKVLNQLHHKLNKQHNK